MRLNETYENYEELVQLANEIFDFCKTIELDKIIYVNDIVKKYYAVLNKFIESNIAIISKNIDDVHFNAAFITVDEYNSVKNILFKEIDQLEEKYNDGIILLLRNNLKKTSILHELQHAYDYYRSEGKFRKSKHDQQYLRFIQRMTDKKEEYGSERWKHAYQRSESELSAFFVQAINNINFFTDKLELRDFNEVYNEFKQFFTKIKFTYLTLKDKKILNRKFSQYYFKIKEKNENKMMVKEMKILTLEDYKINENFYNPFDEEIPDNSPKMMTDKGGLLRMRKEVFNINRVEYTKRTNGQYTVVSKDLIAKGEIVEICPVIMCGIEAKAITGVKDYIFEIDKNKQQYGLVLGYGSLYQHSEKPNLEFGYNKDNKQMYFTALRMIKAGEELTINYGKDYWDERKTFNTLGALPKPEVKPENESGGMGLQQNAAMATDETRKLQFGEHNSSMNPAVSGVAIISGEGL